MHAKIKHLLTFLLCIGSLYASVQITEDNHVLSVSNSWYKIHFNAKKNYTLSSLEINGCTFQVQGAPEYRLDGESPVYNKHFPVLTYLTKATDAAECRHDTVQSPDKTSRTLNFTWTYKSGSRITLVMKFDQSPRIQCTMTGKFTEVVSDWFYSMTVNLPRRSIRPACLLPEQKRAPIPSFLAYFAPAPVWKYVFMPDKNTGVGMAAGENAAGMEYQLAAGEDCFDHSSALLRMVFTRPRDLPLNQEGRMHFTLVAGAPEKKIPEYFRPDMPAIWISELQTEKILTKPGEPHILQALVVNHSSREARLEGQTSIRYKISTEEKQPPFTLNMKPGECRRLSFSLPTSPKMRGGLSGILTLRENGNICAERTVQFAVDDFAPRSVKYVFANAGTIYRPGTERAWAEYLKAQNIGIVEYYLWMTCSIWGIVPEEESWRPNHYSQNILRKSFVKKLIEEMHRCGIKVLSTPDGRPNLNSALSDPEQMLYCKNGQPNIYSGKIYKDKRFGTFKVQGYTPEFARFWAKEMNKSIKMFNWDGCRFDWLFIPDALSDPLYLTVRGPDWYDYRGIPGKKLYPDSDSIGLEMMNIWRSIVEKKNPDFIYGTNIHANEKSARRFPKYLRGVSRHSLLLYEYMIQLNRPEFNTFEKWGELLTRDVQRTRPYGAQPSVGFAPTFPSDSVAGNTVQYVCFASGAKWSGTVSSMRDNKIRNDFMTRFSEYCFDNNFLRLPLKERQERFKVQSTGGRLLYRPFIYERSGKDNQREETLHLIQLPEKDYILQRYRKPPVLKDLRITAVPRAGEKLLSAHALLPGPSPQTLPLPVDGNICRLSQLDDAAIIFLTYEKAGGR